MALRPSGSSAKSPLAQLSPLQTAIVEATLIMAVGLNVDHVGQFYLTAILFANLDVSHYVPFNGI